MKEPLFNTDARIAVMHKFISEFDDGVAETIAFVQKQHFDFARCWAISPIRSCASLVVITSLRSEEHQKWEAEILVAI